MLRLRVNPLFGLRACQELSLIKFVRTVDTADVRTYLKALENLKGNIILKLTQTLSLSFTPQEKFHLPFYPS